MYKNNKLVNKELCELAQAWKGFVFEANSPAKKPSPKPEVYNPKRRVFFEFDSSLNKSSTPENFSGDTRRSYGKPYFKTLHALYLDFLKRKLERYGIYYFQLIALQMMTLTLEAEVLNTQNIFLARLIVLMNHMGVESKRTRKEKNWYDYPLSIANIFAHGKRVKLDTCESQSIWNWLMGESTILVLRRYSSHALQERNGTTREIKKPFRKRVLPYDHGINVALGGIGNKCLFTERTIDADGRNGHFCIVKNSGSILLGLEGSQPSMRTVAGYPHNLKCNINLLSAFLLPKYEHELFETLTSQSGYRLNIPLELDCLRIKSSLTKENNFLEKYKHVSDEEVLTQAKQIINESLENTQAVVTQCAQKRGFKRTTFFSPLKNGTQITPHPPSSQPVTPTQFSANAELGPGAMPLHQPMPKHSEKRTRNPTPPLTYSVRQNSSSAFRPAELSMRHRETRSSPTGPKISNV